MDSLSLFFDARSSNVCLCCGALAVPVMSIGEYKQLFGVEGVRRLLHGDAYVGA